MPTTPRNLVCNAFDSEELIYTENTISFACRVFFDRHLLNPVPPYDAQYEVVLDQYRVGKRLCLLCAFPLKKKTFR
jgi:hypothetical protein